MRHTAQHGPSVHALNSIAPSIASQFGKQTNSLTIRFDQCSRFLVDVFAKLDLRFDAVSVVISERVESTARARLETIVCAHRPRQRSVHRHTPIHVHVLNALPNLPRKSTL